MLSIVSFQIWKLLMNWFRCAANETPALCNTHTRLKQPSLWDIIIITAPPFQFSYLQTIFLWSSSSLKQHNSRTIKHLCNREETNKCHERFYHYIMLSHYKTKGNGLYLKNRWMGTMKMMICQFYIVNSGNMLTWRSLIVEISANHWHDLSMLSGYDKVVCRLIGNLATEVGWAG